MVLPISILYLRLLDDILDHQQQARRGEEGQAGGEGGEDARKRSGNAPVRSLWLVKRSSCCLCVGKGRGD